MTREEIEEKLAAIIDNQLCIDRDKLVPTASFLDDLGADSLDMVELLMTIESEFKDVLTDGQIPEHHSEKLLTYGDLVDYIVSGGVKLPNND